MPRPASTSCLALALALLTTMRAEAASARLPPGVEVRWSAVDGCPDQEEVEDRIATQLAAHSSEVRATVIIAVAELDRDRYALELTVQTGERIHVRRMQASQCELLVRATALVASVAIDARASPQDLVRTMDEVAAQDVHIPDPIAPLPTLLEPPPSTTADQPAPETRTPAITHPPTNRTRHRPDVALALGPRVGGSAGVLPGFGAGAGLVAAVTGRLWRVEAGASHWFARRVRFEDVDDIGASLSLWSFGTRACVVPTVRTIELPVCAGGELGRIHARGFGAPANRDRNATWAAAALAPGMLWLARPWVGFFLGLDGLLALNRPGFTGLGRPLLFRTAQIAVRVVGGVELRLRLRPSGRSGAR